jgi:hypothetical protein
VAAAQLSTVPLELKAEVVEMVTLGQEVRTIQQGEEGVYSLLEVQVILMELVEMVDKE